MDNKIDFNNNECIKSYDNIGSTVYVNICENQTTSIPWGSSDWICFLLVTSIAIVFIGFVIALFIETVIKK